MTPAFALVLFFCLHQKHNRKGLKHLETAIRVEGLGKRYGEVTALEGVSLCVERGEILGVLGANGAGKSTLIECILGTRKADTGNASILGMDPHRDRKRLFDRVGVQFQEGNYPEKIKVGELCEETACLYRHAQAYLPLLEQFGLADKVGQPVSELSGGQKQRLFIVLALIPAPEVVFLDELTTGLDARARREVWKSLAGLKAEGLTILLTSHFMDEVEALCDRILILKHGKTLFNGTVGDAIAQSPCDRFEDAYLWFTDEEEEVQHANV